MSTIVENQRRAYVSAARDDMNRLAESLKCLPEGKRAALIAILAKKSDTPVDITLLGQTGDEIEALMVCDDHLDRAAQGHYSWKLGNGCVFRVELDTWPAR